MARLQSNYRYNEGRNIAARQALGEAIFLAGEAYDRVERMLHQLDTVMEINLPKIDRLKERESALMLSVETADRRVALAIARANGTKEAQYAQISDACFEQVLQIIDRRQELLGEIATAKNDHLQARQAVADAIIERRSRQQAFDKIRTSRKKSTARPRGRNAGEKVHAGVQLPERIPA